MSGNVIGDVPGTDSLSRILILEDVIRACLKKHSCNLHAHFAVYFAVTVHTPLSREVFWHENAKIPRHTARIYANSINSVHCEACYWVRSEQ